MDTQTQVDPGFPQELQDFERHSAIPMLILVVFSIGLLVYEIMASDISPTTQDTILYLDLAISAVFAVEYAISLRLAGRGSRLRYAKTHVVDALAIVPILQPLRLFRSLRIIRAARLARGAALLGKGVSDSATFRPQISDLPWMLTVSAIVIALASSLVYGVERDVPGATITTISDALWWGATTATTVGSSLEPVTPEGRVIALGIMILGITIIAGMAGVFADGLLKQDAEHERRFLALKAHLDLLDQRLDEGAPRSES